MENKMLNGLEAIELMKQGKMVMDDSKSESYIFKIRNNTVYYKTVNGGRWNVDGAFDFSVGYKEYIEPKKLTGWERIEIDECYYTTDSEGEVFESYEVDDKFDMLRYNVANYFSTKGKAEEINLKQTLFRKLQRFSDENGGNENERRYYIVYNSFTDKFEVESHSFLIGVGQVRFASKKIAQQAIELFKEDLIKYFNL